MIQTIYDRIKADFISRSGISKIREPGVISSIIYAFANEIEKLNTNLEESIDQGYSDTATGEYLDRIAALIGCVRIQGVKASGVVRLSAENVPASDIYIPEGTRVATATGIGGSKFVFLTVTDAILLAGNTYVDVVVQAENVGSDYNVAAGSVIIIESVIQGINYCSNLEAIAGGTDTETDSQLRSRIPLYLSGLKRGTKESLESAARSVSGIIDALVIDGETAGTAIVIVAGDGGEITEPMLDDVEKICEEYKGAGIQLAIYPATNVDVNCTFNLYLMPEAVSETVKAAAENAVKDYLDGLGIGETAKLSQVISLIMLTDGVNNAKAILLDGGTSDIEPYPVEEKIVAGTVIGTVVT